MNEIIRKQKYQSYTAATHTVAKTQQIIMLYDGVIRFVQQAKEAIAEKRIEDRYKILIKASDVIQGMQACLDFENGGEIARILYGFYSSIDGRIFSIHRTNSIETCDEIIAEMKTMRDAWQEIDQKTDSDAVTETTPPASGTPTDSEQTITLSA